jgi:hypothetical protein
MTGFRYVLELLNGEGADPGFFISALDGWQVGDTFLAGPELQRFRILAIDTRRAACLQGMRTRSGSSLDG